MKDVSGEVRASGVERGWLKWKPAGLCDPGLKRLVHLAAISSRVVEMPLSSYQEYLAEVWMNSGVSIRHEVGIDAAW